MTAHKLSGEGQGYHRYGEPEDETSNGRPQRTTRNTIVCIELECEIDLPSEVQTKTGNN